MIIRFNAELTRQDIFANGNELAQIMGKDKDRKGKRVYIRPESEELYVTTFRNPVLVTDNYKIGNLRPELRDTVFALFTSPVKITEYDGVPLRFEQRKYPGVWGPNIDTLIFCKALRKINLNGIKRAAEIGSGPGFISKYLLHKHKGIKKMELVDINPQATECARENIKDRKAKFAAGNGIDYLKNKKCDGRADPL